MRSSGNSAPQNCVNNILNVIRGEVPYLRGMGLDGSLYDKPTVEAEPLFIADAEDQIETYEERVEINDITTVTSKDGNITLKPDITVVEY